MNVTREIENSIANIIFTDVIKSWKSSSFVFFY